MKIGCIIQARLGSSRLPNKVLMKLPEDGKKTVLDQVIDRIKRSEYIDEIVIATTVSVGDKRIVDEAEKNEVFYYRGSEENVLSRYYEAAKLRGFDIIVRITSDCPCIDYKVIDKIIKTHIENKNDYTSNTLERTYPHGMDSEVFNFKILEEAYNNADEKYETEHVTPYIYKTKKSIYKIEQVKADEKYNHPEIRITLDTKADYTSLSAVYDFLYKENNCFGLEEIVELFDEKKWLYKINNEIEQKKVCKNLDEEIEEALKLLKRQDLLKAQNYLKENFYGK